MTKTFPLLILLTVALTVLVTACSATTPLAPAHSPIATGPAAPELDAKHKADSAILGNLQVDFRLEQTIKIEGQAEEVEQRFFRQIVLQNGDSSITIWSDALDESVARIMYVQIGEHTYEYAVTPHYQNCVLLNDHSYRPLPASVVSAADLLDDSMLRDQPAMQLIAQDVPLNGFITDHYTFTDNALRAGASQATGEVWLAPHSAVTVRQTGTFTGVLDTMIGINNEVLPAQITQARWEYNLTQLPADTAITLPTACAQQQTGDASVALPAAIRDVYHGLDTITFKTTASADDVTTFYQTEMLARGWQIGEPLQTGSSVQLSYRQDEREALVTIATSSFGENQETSVTIRFSRLQP
ncbi:hypothetical protein [Chloroflexus sp.]|uniref:hypothetical protein n=1 Tax=Chloroflexus sp. TaxID=1904827 RepID=UPI002ACDE2C3|nr:hypothetical protein [Chloroflexus sp.]